MITPKYHVFVCASARPEGSKGFCHQKGAVSLIRKFMEEIDDRELSNDVMVTSTGCFGICAKGPVVLVYPEGTWYGNVTPDDVERIVEEHFENGNKVSDLLI
ncbi:MAG TPA: 2Fe-2S ferredoxin [Anaerovoracaceae bacterium]|nr:2Fe-2S ferredoxin [Anaerovoracaceae bacterium]